MLATQSGDDLLRSGLLPIVNESCRTQIFLANPGMDTKSYQDAFGLNTTEATLVRDLIPRKQFLLKQTGLGSKVLNLELDLSSLHVYTNTPQGVMNETI